MSKYFIINLLLVLILVFGFVGCTKDSDPTIPPDIENPDIDNKVPVAHAGPHGIIMTLPLDTISLLGSGNDTDGVISAYLWSQVWTQRIPDRKSGFSYRVGEILPVWQLPLSTHGS